MVRCRCFPSLVSMEEDLRINCSLTLRTTPALDDITHCFICDSILLFVNKNEELLISIASVIYPSHREELSVTLVKLNRVLLPLEAHGNFKVSTLG